MRGEEDRKQAAADEASRSDASPVHPERFAREVAAFFGDEAIVCTDGGDIVSTTAKWLRRATRVRCSTPVRWEARYRSAVCGGRPVGAPRWRVGIVFGDGGFGFNGFEYDTYVRLGLPVIGVVGNDGVWNNIKTFHKMFYPDRVVAADLGRRPYHDVVTALGGHGELVTAPDELRPALDRAAASGKPALVNVHIAETFRASSNYGQ